MRKSILDFPACFIGRNLLVLLLMLVSTSIALAQITVTGKVTGEDGQGLPGASILVEGTSNGTISDSNGDYTLSVSDESANLIISFVGFVSQTIPLNGRSVVDIALETDSEQLSEVVVVGYGTQIETRVTGAIARADPQEMNRVSTPTVGQALQGRVPGVFIKNQNGQPGQNKTAINIRGFGEPLFIIDGLPVDRAVFDNLNPNDIAELNVLKDAAAAAVYGARAGNGVVLVETVRGSAGDIQLSYRGDVGFQGLTMVPDAIGSWEYMALYNIERQDNGAPVRWDQATVNAFREHSDGSDPENYPSVDMFELIPRDDSPMFTHNLSLRGGSDRVRYFISGNIFDQTGLERNVFGETDTKFKRYNVRGNVDVEVSDAFSFNFDMSYNLQDFYGPRNQFEGVSWGAGQGIFARSGRWRPFHSIEELPGGHMDFPRGAPAGETVNPLNLASAEIGGSHEFQRGFIDFKLGGEYKILPGLSTRATINYQATNRQEKMFQKSGPEYRYDENTDTHIRVRALNADTRVERRNEQTENINFQYFLNQNHSFGNHTITSMYVFEYIQRDFEVINASRIGYDFEIAQLSAGPPSQQFNSDALNRNKRMGHIGRVSYNYADKYSLEVSARYDGSIRFPENSRWGFFPSVSGAWNVTEENFLQGIDFLSQLKLRGSWGRLGYDAAGNFDFLSTFSFDNFYIFGDKTLQRTISNDGLPNPQITWEKMDILNFGVDASFWEGMLEGSFDVFKRHRFDVLGQRILEVPPVVGADLPQQNFQEFENRGLEVGLRHSNTISNNWSYSLGGNISLLEETVIHTDEQDFINKEVERREKRIGRRVTTGDRNPNNVDLFYYETDGLFASQDEIDGWADIDGQGNRSIQVGDAKVIDRNGDGRITDADKYIATSGTQPRLIYGFQARVEWKGLELATFWQGAGLFGWNLDWSEYEEPFPSDGVALTKDLYEAYVPENEWGIQPVSATEARWPRASGIFNDEYDLFLINGAYLRLKQIQVSYTIPTELISAIGLGRVKVYAGGTNLLTFSDIDFLDPEIDENPAQFFGNYHPQTRVYNIGVEIDF